MQESNPDVDEADLKASVQGAMDNVDSNKNETLDFLELRAILTN